MSGEPTAEALDELIQMIRKTDPLVDSIKLPASAARAIAEKILTQAAAVQRVRDLCMDTDGNYLENDDDVNTVGGILEALDGGTP